MQGHKYFKGVPQEQRRASDSCAALMCFCLAICVRMAGSQSIYSLVVSLVALLSFFFPFLSTNHRAVVHFSDANILTVPVIVLAIHFVALSWIFIVFMGLFNILSVFL